MAGQSSDYDPRTFKGLTFHDKRSAFADGSDTPSDYLERCLETVAEREPTVRAFASLNEETARAAAEASSKRWKAGKPLSPIDGMPIGIKDLLETRDMPTQMGCAALDGNFPKNDNAAVWALRQAGAVIFGKTVTAELGGNHPGPTTNPFDPARTPGGSSSGSAAAVASAMMPAAIGTQVGGSIIRPAAFCGNFALKPSQGGIHRGERQTTSMSTHGPHAACIEDMWQVAIEIANRTGGDPGHPGLTGPSTTPHPVRPERLIVLETEGWAKLDPDTVSAFEQLLEGLQRAGVTLLRRADHPWIESMEVSIANATEVCGTITAWENRWYQRNLVDRHPEGVSARTQATLSKAEKMTPDDYKRLLLEREHARTCFKALAPLADAAITLSCPGPAPIWAGDKPGEALAPRPTGDAVFNYGSSLLGAPVVTIPVMAVGGMPVGLQVMGQRNTDARITALARWIYENVEPVAVKAS
ncbi:MAG: amidase [Rhodospirillales bacterium]|nr:amidase [Rhodospirillales bacterium]